MCRNADISPHNEWQESEAAYYDVLHGEKEIVSESTAQAKAESAKEDAAYVSNYNEAVNKLDLAEKGKVQVGTMTKMIYGPTGYLIGWCEEPVYADYAPIYEKYIPKSERDWKYDWESS